MPSYGTGGTIQAVRIAKAYHIKVYNFRIPRDIKEFEERYLEG